MDIADRFARLLPEDSRKKVLSVKSPIEIQALLDDIPYRPEDDNYCALSVFRDGRAHCFDGGLLAAALLLFLGYSPKLIQMIPHNDDDHILAVYKREGMWGAIAQSNFVGLRSRTPVYRSLRELIMSYFDVFYNVDGEFTLTAYSSPLDLGRLKNLDWMCSDADALLLAKKLYGLRQFLVQTPDQLRQLGIVDPLTYKAGMMIANPAGLFKTKKS